MRSPNICAYTMGFSGMKGSPKRVEKVGVGSVMPRSVPATLLVKPDTKWYMAAFLFRREMGGSTPKASAVSMMTTLGRPP